MTPVYFTPGMFGHPSSLCGTKPTCDPGTGTAKAAVFFLDALGTSLFGGRLFCVTHSSSAMNKARNAGFGLVVLRGCWQIPGELGGLPLTVCSTPDSRKNRTLSGSFRSLPWRSVCSNEPDFTQYSFDEFTSNTFGHVSVAAHRSMRPAVLPESGSDRTGHANGKRFSG